MHAGAGKELPRASGRTLALAAPECFQTHLGAGRKPAESFLVLPDARWCRQRASACFQTHFEAGRVLASAVRYLELIP